MPSAINQYLKMTLASLLSPLSNEAFSTLFPAVFDLCSFLIHVAIIYTTLTIRITLQILECSTPNLSILITSAIAFYVFSYSDIPSTNTPALSSPTLSPPSLSPPAITTPSELPGLETVSFTEKRNIFEQASSEANISQTLPTPAPAPSVQVPSAHVEEQVPAQDQMPLSTRIPLTREGTPCCGAYVGNGKGEAAEMAAVIGIGGRVCENARCFDGDVDREEHKRESSSDGSNCASTAWQQEVSESGGNTDNSAGAGC